MGSRGEHNDTVFQLILCYLEGMALVVTPAPLEPMNPIVAAALQKMALSLNMVKARAIAPETTMRNLRQFLTR